MSYADIDKTENAVRKGGRSDNKKVTLLSAVSSSNLAEAYNLIGSVRLM